MGLRTRLRKCEVIAKMGMPVAADWGISRIVGEPSACPLFGITPLIVVPRDGLSAFRLFRDARVYEQLK